jgi:hypothetical protein
MPLKYTVFSRLNLGEINSEKAYERCKSFLTFLFCIKFVS